MNQVKHYFSLQLLLAKRQIKDFGVSVFWSLILGPILFFSLVELGYARTEFTGYILSFLALIWLFNLSNEDRCDFLRLQFKKHTFRRIRIIENLIIVLPFLTVTFLHHDWIPSIILIICAFVSSFYVHRNILHFSIPTPFGKTPFEFIIGFRLWIWIYPFFLALMIIAFNVKNPNLGLVALGISFLVSLFFYQNPEPIYWVWISKKSSKQFLIQKCMVAIKQHFFLNSSLILLCICLFPEHWIIELGMMLFSAILLILNVVAKYSNFPRALSIPDGVYLGISLAVPIFLPLALYYFYKKSNKELSEIL